MNSRQEILEFMNNVILENDGNESTEETKIYETGIDSFSIAMFWLELSEEYEDCFGDQYSGMSPSQEIIDSTLGQLIDIIMKNQECLSKA